MTVTYQDPLENGIEPLVHEGEVIRESDEKYTIRITKGEYKDQIHVVRKDECKVVRQ